MAQDDITAASGPGLPSAPVLLQSIIVQEKSSLGNNGKFEKSIGVKINIFTPIILDMVCMRHTKFVGTVQMNSIKKIIEQIIQIKRKLNSPHTKHTNFFDTIGLFI